MAKKIVFVRGGAQVGESPTLVTIREMPTIHVHADDPTQPAPVVRMMRNRRPVVECHLWR